MPAPNFPRRKASGTVNYFIGNDPSKWTNNVGTFGKVNSSNLSGHRSGLLRNAAPARIRFILTPAQIEADRAGICGRQASARPGRSLLLTLDGAPLTFRKPWSIKPSLARRK